jgi:putative methionine-R-sulfoxide reductase with GAF domain
MTQSYDATDERLVLTLDEITSLTEEGGKPADTLLNVVALIATRFRTDVCSAYLLEPDRSNLVLAATLGLHPQSIGTLRMPLNEGLTGLVAERVLPVAVEDVLQRIRGRGVPLFPRRAADRPRSLAGRTCRSNKRTAELSRE